MIKSYQPGGAGMGLGKKQIMDHLRDFGQTMRCRHAIAWRYNTVDDEP